MMEEADPLKSQAIESSLWELQTLQNHILPSIATAAKFINMPLPSVEWDMSRILENSADDVSRTVTHLHHVRITQTIYQQSQL
jgi:U3 small nucleolar RNA-associated protein 19